MERHTIDIDTLDNYGGVNFELPVGEDFADNLLQKELFNDSYIEKVKEENINPIIDYEKHIFYPAYLTSDIYFHPKTDEWINIRANEFGDNQVLVDLERPVRGQTNDLDAYADDVHTIRFNIYLRRRDADENGDYGEWNTSDEQYWNRWDGNGTPDENGVKRNKVLDNERSTENYGDLLGYMGFNDADIFYQKNRVKKTFLRISIYDSPKRQSQRLLYYSTLFLDSNVLYKKYTKLSNAGFPVDEATDEFLKPLVYESNRDTDGDTLIGEVKDSDLLTTTFTCTSKYDDSASSDGFYLYLFNTIVKPGECTRLYMKVELNNAKYGKSIPLMCPRNLTSSGVKYQTSSYTGETIPSTLPIPIKNELFPEDFTKTYTKDGETQYYVDINEMYENLYIPIFVRYNNKKCRFEWYIVDNTSCGGDRVINLYEPRINKLKDQQNNG